MAAGGINYDELHANEITTPEVLQQYRDLIKDCPRSSLNRLYNESIQIIINNLTPMYNGLQLRLGELSSEERTEYKQLRDALSALNEQNRKLATDLSDNEIKKALKVLFLAVLSFNGIAYRGRVKTDKKLQYPSSYFSNQTSASSNLRVPLTEEAAAINAANRAVVRAVSPLRNAGHTGSMIPNGAFIETPPLRPIPTLSQLSSTARLSQSNPNTTVEPATKGVIANNPVFKTLAKANAREKAAAAAVAKKAAAAAAAKKAAAAAQRAANQAAANQTRRKANFKKVAQNAAAKAGQKAVNKLAAANAEATRRATRTYRNANTQTSGNARTYRNANTQTSGNANTQTPGNAEKAAAANAGNAKTQRNANAKRKANVRTRRRLTSAGVLGALGLAGMGSYMYPPFTARPTAVPVDVLKPVNDVRSYNPTGKQVAQIYGRNYGISPEGTVPSYDPRFAFSESPYRFAVPSNVPEEAAGTSVYPPPQLVTGNQLGPLGYSTGLVPSGPLVSHNYVTNSLAGRGWIGNINNSTRPPIQPLEPVVANWHGTSTNAVATPVNGPAATPKEQPHWQLVWPGGKHGLGEKKSWLEKF